MQYDLIVVGTLVLISFIYVIKDMRKFWVYTREYMRKLDRDKNKDNPDYF